MKKKIKQNKNIIIAFLAGAFLVGAYVMLTATSSRETMYGTPNNGDAGVVVQRAIERESESQIKERVALIRKKLQTKCERIKMLRHMYDGNTEDKVRICNGLYDEYKPKICRIYAKALSVVDDIKYGNQLPANYKKILDFFVDDMRTMYDEASVLFVSNSPIYRKGGVRLLSTVGASTIFANTVNPDTNKDTRDSPGYWRLYDKNKEKIVTSLDDLRELNSYWIDDYYSIGYSFDCIK